MSGLMDSVDRRTGLAWQSALELLLFRLNGPQLYGINVFKVREVLQCPRLHSMPGSNALLCGVANIRGMATPVLDLARAIGQPGLFAAGGDFVIITEYSLRVQGFLVKTLERTVTQHWQAIQAPPAGSGSGHYLTAITHIDGQLVEIIDVEKIFIELSPCNESLGEDLLAQAKGRSSMLRKVLLVDDSRAARAQVLRCLQALGMETQVCENGRQALHWLREQAASGKPVSEQLLMVIADIEMPEMDGYRLTSEIRSDPRLANLHVLLHSSVSGFCNQAMVKKVGADDFLEKCTPDALAVRVLKRLQTAGGF